MIKRFVILRRKPEMSVEEFWNYWENIHGPLIAKIPGLIKYIQYHVTSERLDEVDEVIDGIAELWFDSDEAQKKAYQSAEYQAVVDDEPNLFEMNSHYVHPVMTKKVVSVVD
ncbi:MAG: EthD domain-containing protein [Pseudomonadota bacterium]